jgi:hypothetical protein
MFNIIVSMLINQFDHNYKVSLWTGILQEFPVISWGNTKILKDECIYGFSRSSLSSNEDLTRILRFYDSFLKARKGLGNWKNSKEVCNHEIAKILTGLERDTILWMLEKIESFKSLNTTKCLCSTNSTAHIR